MLHNHKELRVEKDLTIPTTNPKTKPKTPWNSALYKSNLIAKVRKVKRRLEKDKFFFEKMLLRCNTKIILPAFEV